MENCESVNLSLFRETFISTHRQYINMILDTIRLASVRFPIRSNVTHPDDTAETLSRLVKDYNHVRYHNSEGLAMPHRVLVLDLM